MADGVTENTLPNTATPAWLGLFILADWKYVGM